MSKAELDVHCYLCQRVGGVNCIQNCTYAQVSRRDAQSRHVKNADEAINLGSIDQEGGNPFLNIELIVRTAVSAGVDAIHPGYGYLSENADFADAVKKAGLIFIGPSSNA